MAIHACANLPGNRGTIHVRTLSSKHQGTVEVEGRLGADMLDLRLPVGTELVEAQAVGLGVDLAQAAGLAT